MIKTITAKLGAMRSPARWVVYPADHSEDEARDGAAELGPEDFDAPDIGGSWEADCVGTYEEGVPLGTILAKHEVRAKPPRPERAALEAAKEQSP